MVFADNFCSTERQAAMENEQYENL